MVTNTTATMEVVDTGERRDGRGRKLTPAARRQQLVAAWRESGLTQAAFARREGINYTTFCAWVQQAPRADRNVGVGKVRFTEVHMAATSAPGVEVRLPDGTLVRGGGAREVAAVVRALRS